MFTFLLILLILDSLVLIAAILLQSGKGGGLAASFGGVSSSADSLLGTRQAGNLLTGSAGGAGRSSCSSRTFSRSRPRAARAQVGARSGLHAARGARRAGAQVSLPRTRQAGVNLTPAAPAPHPRRRRRREDPGCADSREAIATVTQPAPTPGFLLLEDGALFRGVLHGVLSTTVAEVVFTTNMSGYQEVFTDPSYRGQIVVMTAPMIGNYGVNPTIRNLARRRWLAWSFAKWRVPTRTGALRATSELPRGGANPSAGRR